MTDNSKSPISEYKRVNDKRLKATVDKIAVDNSLPELTAKQRRFVEEVLAGKPIWQAHEIAYGGNYNKSSRAVEATKTHKHPNIQAWLGAAKKLSLVSGTVTFDRWLGDQHALIQLAIENGKLSTAQEGHKTLGKALGFIDKPEDKTGSVINPEMLLQSLGKILPPILGMTLWKQVEERLATVLLGGTASQVRLIEGTAIAVKDERDD